LKAQRAAPQKTRAPRGQPKREMRFRDLVEPALEAKQLRGNEASSIETDRVRLRRVLPAIGRLKIGQLTPGRIESFLQDLARGDATHPPVKGATVNRFHSLLLSIFSDAVRKGVIDANPLAGGKVQRFKESPIVPRFLRPAEQRRLLAVIRQSCPEKVLEIELAILTGMRRSEQWNARWQDWQIREGILNVKGKTGPRKVRINHAAHRCLARMKKRARGEYITPERNDGPRDRRLWFEKAVKKAELSPAFRYHDCRHTFCSRLVGSGVPLLEVQQLAGHKKYSTTLRYAHLSADHLRRAIEKVAF
jgi:integrase